MSRRLFGEDPYEGAASEGGEISLWRSWARGCVPEALGLRRPGLCPCAERRLPREAQVVLGGPVPTVGSRARRGPAFGRHLGTTRPNPASPACVLASPLRVDGPGVLRWGLGGAEGDRGRHNRLLRRSPSCFAWPRSGRELNACLPRTKPSEFVSRFARIRLCFLVPNPPLAVQLCCKFPPRSRGTRLEAAEQVAPCRPPSNPAGP